MALKYLLAKCNLMQQSPFFENTIYIEGINALKFNFK
jgi:hypothetical protein